jgi:hypothetical protein
VRGGALASAGAQRPASSFLGRLTEGFSRFLHLSLKGLARFFPGFLLERHTTIARAFARVLAWIFATPALSLASIVPFARVRLSRGAFTYPGARVIAAFAFSFAGIEPATHVLVLQ